MALVDGSLTPLSIKIASMRGGLLARRAAVADRTDVTDADTRIEQHLGADVGFGLVEPESGRRVPYRGEHARVGGRDRRPGRARRCATSRA